MGDLGDFMDTKDLLDKLGNTKWFTLIKALAFDGGPSSTRWVYLGAFLTVSVCLTALVGSICFVYVRSHLSDALLVGLSAAWVTAILAFATNSQNLKHTLDAQVANPGSSTASSTPVSTTVTEVVGTPGTTLSPPQ